MRFGFCYNESGAIVKTNNGIEFYLQCQAPDMSGDFCDLANTYFLAE